MWFSIPIMTPELRKQLEQQGRIRHRILPENRIDVNYAQEIKTAIEHSAREQSIDLKSARVSLWVEVTNDTFECRGKAHSIYDGYLQADKLSADQAASDVPRDIFIIDAIGPEKTITVFLKPTNELGL
jgi:hypothetical protein